MKTLAAWFALTVLLATTASAQPQIAYMFPDIGAAGMNTYVEIVAPASSIGTFGGNGQFANTNNGTESIGIGPASIADTARIVVGPIVVSWEGRLISTQIFVKPGAANGIVPLRVTVSGLSSTVDFEIVTPQVLGAGGTLTGGGVLGSGGAFGTRSKRGAMIVDRLVFDGGVYTVSTTDTDPVVPGNQGYLPAIIISKNTLAFINGASLNVNGSASNGGAGGGGGGGAYCDRTFFGDGGPGSDGGNGFAAGGAGGRNNSGPGSPSSGYRSPGTGSGAAGASFTGVAPGGHIDCNKYESAGGGTGHPFGRSGLGPCFPTTGQNGGGSAANDNTGGGGGGYGTAGANGTGSNAGTNGGQITGNPQGVPVAGGSGGSSGNPRSGAGSGICAGSGGGGGGAVVLYSQTNLNNTGAAIGARGGNGGSGSGTSNGGSGSGGYVSLGAKYRFSSGGNGDVTGGPGANGGGNGGNGRARYDGFIAVTPTFAGAVSPYVGPTIDTLSYVQTRTFTLQGTKGNDVIQIWMRRDSGPWQLQPAPIVAGRDWSLQVTVPSSGTYYFVAMQVVPSPSTTQYRNEPGFVMSQAAANMVKVDLIPQINVDRTSIQFPTVLCNETYLDSVKIFNTGDDTLRVNPAFFSGADFQIVGPLGRLDIAPRPGDTVVWLKIRFRPATPGQKVDTLILNNNDPRPGKNPTKIVLRGRRANIQQSLSKTVIDFGDVCRDSLSAPQSLFFNNAGDTTAQIKSIQRLGGGSTPFSFTITQPVPGSLPLTVAAGSNTEIRVTFRPASLGAFADSFRVLVGPCDSPFIFVVRGRGVAASITANPDPIDFGSTPVNLQASLPLTITNSGTIPCTIKEIFFSSTGVPITASTTGLNGANLAVGANVSGQVLLTPQAAGTISGRICFVLDALCPDTVCFDITGTATAGRLVLSRTELIFEADSCDDNPPAMSQTFTLYNRGTAPVRIDGFGLLRNLVGVTASPPLPQNLAANDSITFTVSWTPGTSGVDTITINTQAPDPAQRAMKVAVVLRRERSKVEALATNGSALPPAIDFGTVLDCSGSSTFNLILRNSGTLTENVSGGFVTGTAFALAPPAPYVIPAGTDRALSITFAAPAPGTYNDTLVLRNAACNREIRIPVAAVRAGLTMNAVGVSFGNSNVGFTKRGTASITNTSNTPNNVKLRVSGVTILPPGSPFTIVAPTGLPKDLAPNEVATVDVDFLPGAEQAYGAQICFKIDAPCDTTICVPLSGSGVQSSVLVRAGSLNFGTQYICQDDSLAFFILNTAITLPLSVDSIKISGADAAAFELIRPTGLPLSIVPGDSAEAMVRFVPSKASSDGLKNATLEIYTSDLAQPVVLVALIGERRRQSLATPTQLDFGTVEAGTSVLDTLVLENRTTVPMQITALSVPAPFVIVEPASLPTSIGAFDSLRVIVRFTPTDSVAYNATLVVQQASPCQDSTLIPVQGRGRITPVGTVDVAIDASLTGKPGDRLAIPIRLIRAQLLAASGATTFRAKLRFNKTLLLPLRARAKGMAFPKTNGIAAPSADIVDDTFDGTDRVVTVEIKSDPVPTSAPDTLGFLDVEVMLGDTLTTPIAFDTLFWTDGQVVASSTDGMFTLDGYCTVGGNRLIKVGPGFGIKAATPNPFNPSTQFVFQVIEDAPVTLVVFDMLGRRVATLVDGETLRAGSHIRTWDARDHASGLYFGVLSSPTQRSTYQVLLAK